VMSSHTIGRCSPAVATGVKNREGMSFNHRHA
jgi:hypothetical protein